jgi:cytochrome P450
MSWDRSVALMRYEDGWRYRRKICQQILHKELVKNYHSVMFQKVHAMLDGLLKSPENFEHHNKMYALLTFSPSTLLIFITQVIHLSSNENDVWI